LHVEKRVVVGDPDARPASNASPTLDSDAQIHRVQGMPVLRLPSAVVPIAAVTENAPN
jgi:hypothetical protein